MRLFEITKASVLFPENFRYNLTFYESQNFSDSSVHCILESENFRFPFSNKNSVRWVVKCEKLNLENCREFIRYLSKIEHEWNVHLDIFSCPHTKENSRQNVPLRTDILQITVVGCSV